jgi:hypothetical protein
MDVVREGDGIELDAAFLDNRRNGSSPESVHWSLYCETTKQELQAPTAVAPEVTVNEDGSVTATARIDVPGGLNAIHNNRNWRELRTLLVTANLGTDRQFTEEYQYYVKNLAGRS